MLEGHVTGGCAKMRELLYLYAGDPPRKTILQATGYLLRIRKQMCVYTAQWQGVSSILQGVGPARTEKCST
jgi:hypothetical protein